MQTKTTYDLEKTLLFRYQNTLAELPLPQLRDTISQYLQHIRLSAKDSEYIQSKKLCKDFEEGIGKILQLRLKQKTQKNWLIDSYNKTKFLQSRLPLPFCSNLVVAFDENISLFCSNNIQSSATNIFLAFSHLFNHILTNKVEQQKISQNYLCSELFHGFFNTSRIPSFQCDYMKTYNYLECNHGIVVCRQKFYEVRLFDQSYKVLPEEIIKKQIIEILQLSKKEKNGYPVGALTGLNRNKWAEIRNKLIQNNKNKFNLEKIQSALLLICLDPDEHPQTMPERKNLIHYGNKGENRFFDKSQQFIIDGNGKVGLNSEHCAMDGYPIAYFCGKAIRIFDDLKKELQQDNALPNFNYIPKQLIFDLEEEIKKEILGAIQFIQNQSRKQFNVSDKYMGFGLKKAQQIQINIDSLCLLASQLGYFKMQSRIPLINKPASSRRYRYGRIESIRSPTPISKQFLESMQSDAPLIKKYELLKKALKQQKVQAYKILNGKGMLNHLIALVKSLKQGEHCKLFQNHTFRRVTKQFDIRITNITAWYITDAYIPEDKSAIRISFNLKQDCIIFHVNSLIPDAPIFYEYLKQSLNQLYDIIEKAKALKPKL